jgi:DNA-binding MarR family transcriptional regulator
VPDRIETLATLLRKVHRFTGAAARQVMHEYGLPFQAPPILGQISKNAGVTVSELARATRLAKSQVSNTVDKLVELGFVERYEDAADQRLVHLRASARAQEHLMRVQAAVVQRLQSALAGFPPETITSLISGLETLYVALEKDSIAGDDHR